MGPFRYYIYLRTDINWLTFRPENYNNGVDKVISIWNKTFTMPHNIFRHKLQLLAQESLQNVSNASIIKNVSDLYNTNCLIIPIDDDDWLSPNLVTTLESIEDIDQFYGIRWESYHPWGDKNYYIYCSTDNYAINPRHAHPLSVHIPLLSHSAASVLFYHYDYELNKIPRLPIKQIQATLSAVNKNIGSTTTLKEHRDDGTLHLLYSQCQKLLNNECKKMAHSWVFPYLSKLQDIYNELGESMHPTYPMMY